MTPRAPVPAGVLTLAGETLRRQRDAEGRCLDLLAREGYQPLHLPVLEYADGEPGPGYRFVDRGGHLVAVRTDFTPLAARVLAPRLAAGPLPLAVCYAGEVVRPRPARLRQLPELYQLGFERYGEGGGGAGALDLALRLLATAGVETAATRVTVSVAGMAEAALAQLLEQPPDEDLLELARVRDLDALADAVAAGAPARRALEALLLGEDAELWADFFGLRPALARLAPLFETARRAGADAALDVAPRLPGAYYRGALFSVWGRRTQAVVAGGGEYAVAAAGAEVPAAGACLALGVALEEAGC